MNVPDRTEALQRNSNVVTTVGGQYNDTLPTGAWTDTAALALCHIDIVQPRHSQVELMLSLGVGKLGRSKVGLGKLGLGKLGLGKLGFGSRSMGR